MPNSIDKEYENIVLGDGPISRTLVRSLNKTFSGQVLIIDAGERLSELVNKISVKSNIFYDSHLRTPSFHLHDDSRIWYGGCQGWPTEDTKTKSKESLPISFSNPRFIKIIKELSRELGFHNFNFFTSKVNLALRKKYFSVSTNSAIEFIYCKILKQPSLEKFNNVNSKNKKNVYLTNIIITKIEPFPTYVEVIGINSIGQKISFKARQIHMALGTIENTRILLNSAESLNLSNNQYLGRFLSDHLSISVSNIKSSNIAKIIRDFSRTRTFDGSLLWPRIRLKNYLKTENSPRSFIHASHFTFYNSTPFIYRLLKKLNYTNYYFSNKKEGEFQLNFFFEKSNSIHNSIKIEKVTKFEIPSIILSFKVDDCEIKSYSKIANSYFNFMHDVYSLSQGPQELSLVFDGNSKENYRTAVHQSGTYRMSLSPSNGVVNSNSELWSDTRIRVLGAGVLPRSSATHPTFISMALARLLE